MSQPISSGTTDLVAEIRRNDAARREQVMELPVVEAAHCGAITAPRDGDVRICASVGPAGEVIAVWAAAPDLEAATSRTVSPAGAAFPDARSPRSLDVRVTVQRADGGVAVTSIAGLSVANITAQPLPGGRILIVGVRSYWRPEGADRNAVVFDADGSVLAEEVLGDGISHVLTDSAGRVWVGYFDEGVYGNYGWGGRDSSEPVGSCGLVRFSPDLRPEWRYASTTSPFGFINDCYALNVDGATAWACYDSAFPIVRINNDVLAGWRNDTVTGVKALAVAGDGAALYAGYRADRNRLVVGELGGSAFEPNGEYRVVLPGSADMPSGMQVIGRGPSLHFLTDSAWYQLRLGANGASRVSQP
jgi:hypothetical protein